MLTYLYASVPQSNDKFHIH